MSHNKLTKLEIESEIESLKKTLNQYDLKFDSVIDFRNNTETDKTDFDKKSQRKKTLSFLDHIHSLQKPRSKSLTQAKINNLSN